jgi:hypothetical protein
MRGSVCDRAQLIRISRVSPAPAVQICSCPSFLSGRTLHPQPATRSCEYKTRLSCSNLHAATEVKRACCDAAGIKVIPAGGGRSPGTQCPCPHTQRRRVYPGVGCCDRPPPCIGHTRLHQSSRLRWAKMHAGTHPCGHAGTGSRHAESAGVTPRLSTYTSLGTQLRQPRPCLTHFSAHGCTFSVQDDRAECCCQLSRALLSVELGVAVS